MAQQSNRMVERERSVLLVIDLQESYIGNMFEEARVVSASERVIQAAKLLQIPIIITEQYPAGLGATREEISRHLSSDVVNFSKHSFSCMGATGLPEHLKSLGRDQVVIAGIETHVCVNQTVHDLLAEGYCPHLLRDAITSRFPPEDTTGWEKMIGSGAVPTCTEAVLFEWLRDSQAAEFKAIHALVV